MNLTALGQAFRRKVDSELTAIYHKALDGEVTDAGLTRVTREILANEEKFPTIAMILRYVRGDAKQDMGAQGPMSKAFILGTDIKFTDYVRDPNRYAEELCRREYALRDEAKLEREAKAAEEERRKAAARAEAERQAAAVKEQADAERQLEPGAADRPHREARQADPDQKREAPF